MRLECRLARCLLLAVVGSWLISCASGPEIPPDAVFLSPQQYEEMRRAAAEADAAKARISAMEERLAKLHGEMEAVLTRSALKAYQPRRLSPMIGGPQRAALSDAVVIKKRGDKPRKRRLEAVVGGSQATILSFWATWCVPCISDEELAHMESLRRQLARYNVSVVSLAIDDLDKVLSHPKASQWHYPLWFKKGGHIELLPQQFIEQAGMGLPLFVLLDRDGLIHYTYKRKLDDDLVNELVDAALSL